MSQYEVAKMIFESDDGLTVKDLMRSTGNVESTVRTSLHKLESKGYVIEDNRVYKQDPDTTFDDLERIRSYTIDELRDK